MEAADGAVVVDGPPKDHFFNRLKFLWHTKTSRKLSDDQGAGGSQNYLLSGHDYQNTSRENANRARSPTLLALSDDMPMWDGGNPWEIPLIFDDFLNANIGNGWQGSGGGWV
jgi:hypothetical protein